MDIKNLLKSIGNIEAHLEDAKRIIKICDGDVHKTMIYADPIQGHDCRLPIGKEVVRELAVNELQKCKAELAILQEAKTTAERVIAGMLPENKTSA
ncbi:hypothetical protein [Serratia sp. D1N4]